MASKNNRIGRGRDDNKPSDFALPKYVGGNVGATWKTKCKGLAKPLRWGIKRDGRYT